MVASGYRIDSLQDRDWEWVRAVYLEGTATGNAAFEQTAPSWESWNESHLSQCRLVARLNETVIGWAALAPISNRCVFAGVAEVSIYVGEKARRQGVGRLLLQAIIEASEKEGIWTLESLIFPENVASLALHQQCGFRTVGIRERIGQMNGVWRDVVLLERRSSKVGV